MALIRYIQPPIRLQSYVQAFLFLQNDNIATPSATFNVLADGCPGLIFQEKTVFADNCNRPFPQLFLHGLTTHHSGKIAHGAYRNVIVYLQPHALKSLFGVDAHLLTDTYIDLQDCINTSLSEQLLETASWSDKILIISDFLIDQIAKRTQDAHFGMTFVVETIKNSNGTKSLKDIRSALRLSERTLERIMKTHVGVSPKLFSRICRFQATLNHLCDQPFDLLTELAYEYAYADQSHCIRDFQKFAGVTPRQFLNKGVSALRNFSECT